MEQDRRRIERIEMELGEEGEEGGEEYDMMMGPASPGGSGGGGRASRGGGTRLSTSQYLQRQRQLLLEDYLRKHMSLPLQARSPVLAGLEQLQPPREPRVQGEPHEGGDGQTGSKTRDELLSQLSEMESKAHAVLNRDSPLPDIGASRG